MLMQSKSYFYQKLDCKGIGRMKTGFLVFLSTIIISLLTACGMTTDPKIYYPVVEGKDIRSLNQQILAAAQVNTAAGDYLLGPGDLLDIKVFESEELSTTVRVSSRGFVTLPLLNQVSVEGFSSREAEKTIEDLYKVSYLKDPHVSIFVKEHVSQRITLVGEFEKPGTYDYYTKMRLLGVLAMGGGLSEMAGTTVQIRRVGGAKNGESQLLVVDLDKLIRDGQSELNIEILGSDVIFVPEAGTFLVEGAVRKPGAYPINKSLNVREAIGVAGGFKPYAIPNKITLIRYNEDSGMPEIKDIDFATDDYGSMFMKDGDVLLALSDGWRKFVNGAGFRAGLPWFGVGYENPED